MHITLHTRKANVTYRHCLYVNNQKVFSMTLLRCTIFEANRFCNHVTLSCSIVWILHVYWSIACP